MNPACVSRTTRRRGQMALEYITTYGWAFVGMLVVLGALAYYGVFTPDTYLPDACQFPQETQCLDYTVQSSGLIQVMFVNNFGRLVNISGAHVLVPATGGERDCGLDTIFPIEVDIGKNFNITCNIPSAKFPSNKNRFLINLTYSRPGASRSHTIKGELYTKPS